MFTQFELGELGEIITGKTPKKSSADNYGTEDVPFIKPDDLTKDTIKTIISTNEFVSNEGAATGRVVGRGTVLVTCIGIIGKVGIVEVDNAIFNQQINAIIPNENIVLSKYLAYVLLSMQKQLQDKANAPIVPIINKTDFSKVKIRIPNLEYQRKVITLLDEVKSIIDKRQSQITALDELRQSLFLEMFGDPTRNVKWPIKTFGEISDSKLGKMLDQKKQQEEGLLFKRYLGNRHVQWGRFVLEDLPLMGFKETELERYRVNKGDLLICEGGEVGRCAIWYDEDEEIYYQKALHRAKIKSDIVTPEFLQNVMFIYAQRGGFKDYTTVATIAHLTAAKLNKLPIPIPPIELQKEFTVKNNALLQQREILIEAKSEFENLYNSLLQKAFKGELFQD